MSATASISGAIKFLAQFAGTSTFENATLLRAMQVQQTTVERLT
jgi:hypothetical protein